MFCLRLVCLHGQTAKMMVSISPVNPEIYVKYRPLFVLRKHA